MDIAPVEGPMSGTFSASSTAKLDSVVGVPREAPEKRRRRSCTEPWSRAWDPPDLSLCPAILRADGRPFLDRRFRLDQWGPDQGVRLCKKRAKLHPPQDETSFLVEVCAFRLAAEHAVHVEGV